MHFSPESSCFVLLSFIIVTFKAQNVLWICSNSQSNSQTYSIWYYRLTNSSDPWFQMFWPISLDAKGSVLQEREARASGNIYWAHTLPGTALRMLYTLFNLNNTMTLCSILEMEKARLRWLSDLQKVTYLVSETGLDDMAASSNVYSLSIIFNIK